MIRSLPQLLVAIHTRKKPGSFVLPKLDVREFVPAYRVCPKLDVQQEAHEAAGAVSHLADRLHRLTNAYAAWNEFEPEPFFDLYPEQARALCYIAERQKQVHITVYADLLLPSFRSALNFWSSCYYPALEIVATSNGHLNGYSNGVASSGAGQIEWAGHLRDQLQEMVERIHAAQTVLRDTVRQLQHGPDVGFLASWGALEERERHALTDREQALQGFPLPQQAPTLTLEIAFPLPPRRRPHRRKALWRWRKRRLQQSVAR